MIDDVDLISHPPSTSITQNGETYEDTVFVVFDTVMFSSSVVALLENHVDLVRPLDSVSALQEYREKDDWLVGGETSHDGTDFENSVHHINSVLGYNQPDQTKAVLQSSNGAVASHLLARELDPLPREVIIGAPANLKSVHDYIDETYGSLEEPISVILYGAGHRGHPVLEDIFTAWILYMELELDEKILSYDNSELLLRSFMDSVKWSDASWFNNEDIDIVSKWNTTSVVPVFDFEKDGFVRSV